ncbi:hypothetical protein AAMO2058_001012700 [Amorphochlora amoebiformis]
MASSSASDALRPSRIIVPGVGNWSPGGLYSSYSSEYPVELENLLSEQEFKHCMNRINTAIIFRWPCMPCYGFSTVCCPFTCRIILILGSTPLTWYILAPRWTVDATSSLSMLFRG